MLEHRAFCSKVLILAGLVSSVTVVHSIRNPSRKAATLISNELNETTLIVLSSPSVNNSYYQPVFKQIIDFMVNFACLVEDKDEIAILVDAATRPYFKGRISDKILIDANLKDIWIRDFGPVLPSKQIKFRYLPLYRNKSTSKRIENSFEKWLFKNHLKYKTKSEIALDGGNVVDSPDGSRAVISERIFLENPGLKRAHAKKVLKSALGVRQLAIIRELPNDTTGHADGILMWASNNKILLPDSSEPERTEIIKELKASFPGVIIQDIPDYFVDSVWRGFTTACNVYINAIVTDRYVYMPTFNGSHDASMVELMQSHTTKTVVPVPSENVCFMGGSVRCLSWQVKGDLKKKILKLMGR